MAFAERRCPMIPPESRWAGVVLVRNPDRSFDVLQSPETARVPYDLLADPRRADQGVDVVGVFVYFGFPQSVCYRMVGQDGDDVLLELE
jgi:hypothetical protein